MKPSKYMILTSSNDGQVLLDDGAILTGVETSASLGTPAVSIDLQGPGGDAFINFYSGTEAVGTINRRWVPEGGLELHHGIQVNIAAGGLVILYYVK